MKNKLPMTNEATYLLTQFARGYVPMKYRAVMQKILTHHHKDLFRAIYFQELLNDKKIHPAKRARRALGVSRSSLYRSYNLYKHLFK
ncbi:hypothetical protein MNBD_GAMMA12-2630 [hydrothermal vent metagenome]|uniref:Uncharacterized protein n=1 Tax=hydrothermal vent metagenome TaxID=652676 RepID=A0A3B0Z2D7_9ZZZZ